VTRYIDLLADLLLVRRVQPFHGNLGKRLVKSPKVFVRDSGLVHALLGIADFNDLSGHPVVGASWEGFVIENLIAASPFGTQASFYRTAAGAEIDLLLEIPKEGLWAIEIKRAATGRPERGFHIACNDLQPTRRFIVNAGQYRYPLSPDLEAIGVGGLAAELAAL
jgi:predicted AAA+ superfamily ATPase